jgi:folate-binding protein YgfZ
MTNDPSVLTVEKAFFRWQPAAWLRISGDDAFTFLQGQFTNDLRALAGGAAVYGLWLNHKGKVIADSFVVGGPAQEYWVGSYFSPAAVIKERLDAFIIADDVVIEDVTSDWSAVSVWGASGVKAPAVSFVGRRGGAPQVEFVFKRDADAEIRALISERRELTQAEVERLRIEAGIPAVPADIGSSELPNEGGLEESAISYNKGCYLGQEVMARLKSMGSVRRRLMRARADTVIPSLPAELFEGDRRIGELRTAAPTEQGLVGLALVSMLHLNVETPVSFSANGPANLTLRPL